jgi:hypothetical protein
MTSQQANVESVAPNSSSNLRLVDYEDEANSSRELEVKNIEYDFVSLEKLRQLGYYLIIETKVRQFLDKNLFNFRKFGRIEENPSKSTLERALDRDQQPR